jgi:hypothetical protein
MLFGSMDRIGYLLKRPVGRPPNEVRRFDANLSYQAGGWMKPRRVIAKVKCIPENFIRTSVSRENISRPAERVVALWRGISTAPLNRNVEVHNECGGYVLAFPCRRTDDGCINGQERTALA